MDYVDEGTVRIVEGGKTVEQRILEQKDGRKLALQEKAGDVCEANNSHTERRALILNEATDLIEDAYQKLRLAIDTMSICDLGAQEKYAGLVREMGKAVRDFSGKL